MPVAEPAPRYDPRRHRRRSIRLPDHDYAGGVYFVTICTHGRLHLFGDVVDGAMILNAAGETVWAEWERSEALRTEVTLDAFVAMPNHVHGIIHIAGDASTDAVGATGRSPLRCGPNARPGLPPKSLGAFVAGFKSAVTKRINAMRGTPGGAVWQRNYYGRVIRAARALHIARRYVRDNPARWHRDRCHLGRR
jgi:REP element-mobilizing transposase RayT